MLIIENDFLKIELNKHGACLKSIFDKRKNKELLYQPDGRSWSGQDVVIFPVIAALKNHRYKVDGKSYSLKNFLFAKSLSNSILFTSNCLYKRNIQAYRCTK